MSSTEDSAVPTTQDMHAHIVVDDPGHAPSPWWALVVVCFAQFMVVLDATITNVALPTIQTDLKITPENLRKIINRGVPIREIPDDPYPGLMRNFGFNRQARPDLSDAELIERFYGPGATTGEIPVGIRSKYSVVREPDGVRAILDENGNRIEVPKNRRNRKGYHYADDAPPRREVAESNKEIRDQLERELRRGGKSARTREDRLRNIELVHRKLRERADRTADDPEWKPGQPVPEGVLVVRRSHGNELRLKEIPIGDETAGDTDNFWWPRAMELRTQRGRTNWAGLREDIAVLTRKQFSYFVHNAGCRSGSPPQGERAESGPDHDQGGA